MIYIFKVYMYICNDIKYKYVSKVNMSLHMRGLPPRNTSLFTLKYF